MINRVKAGIVFPIVTVGVLISPWKSQANQIDPVLPFEIGGKAKVQNRDVNITINTPGINWSLPKCGSFDPSLTVTNFVNDFESKFNAIAQNLVKSATGAVANFAMMEIARLDPVLFEFMQQGRLEGLDLFDTSVASCEAISEKLIEGGTDALASPGQWLQIAGVAQWEEKAIEGKDVAAVDKNIKENMGNGGLGWVAGKKAGGETQPAINTVEDTTKAGVNLLAGHAADSISEITSEQAPWLKKLWNSRDEISGWIKDVIGETSIQTCQECDRVKTQPGRGIYAKIAEEHRLVTETLLALLNNGKSIFSHEELASISAPGYQISQQVIEALKAEDTYQGMLAERLAEEIATVRVVEKLIAARRVLLAGVKEPNIATNADAVNIVERQVLELKEEMNMLQQDIALRESIQQSVATKLLMRKKRAVEQYQLLPKVRSGQRINDVTGR